MLKNFQKEKSPDPSSEDQRNHLHGLGWALSWVQVSFQTPLICALAGPQFPYGWSGPMRKVASVSCMLLPKLPTAPRGHGIITAYWTVKDWWDGCWPRRSFWCVLSWHSNSGAGSVIIYEWGRGLREVEGSRSHNHLVALGRAGMQPSSPQARPPYQRHNRCVRSPRLCSRIRPASDPRNPATALCNCIRFLYSFWAVTQKNPICGAQSLLPAWNSRAST